MGNSITLGRVFGINIGLNYSWFLIFMIVTWSMATGVLPGEFPGVTPDLYWAVGLLMSLLFFLSILLHELGHSLVAIRSGIPVRRIDLFIFGGIAQISREPDAPGQEALIAIAGPLTSFALAVVFYLLANALGGILGQGSYYLAEVNLVLGVFNLAPGFPLDGGRVLRAAIWKISGNVHMATKAAATAGKVLGWIVIFLGVTSIMGGDFSGLWYVLIGWFLLNSADSSFRQDEVQRILGGVTVRQVMTAEPLTVSPDLTLDRLVEDYFLTYKHGGFPVVEAGRPLGLVELNAVREIGRDLWAKTQVREVMVSGEGVEVGSGEPCAQVLGRLGNRRLLVVQDETLVGIVSQSDVLRYLQMRGAFPVAKGQH